MLILFFSSSSLSCESGFQHYFPLSWLQQAGRFVSSKILMPILFQNSSLSKAYLSRSFCISLKCFHFRYEFFRVKEKGLITTSWARAFIVCWVLFLVGFFFFFQKIHFGSKQPALISHDHNLSYKKIIIQQEKKLLQDVSPVTLTDDFLQFFKMWSQENHRTRVTPLKKLDASFVFIKFHIFFL